MVPVRRWSVWWMVALVASFLVAVSGLPEVTRSVPVAQAAIELTEASPVVANPLPVFGSRYVAPAPSGAPPALPPNPTLLRAGDGGGAAPTNHGFETPGFTAATPVNHDFALQASVVGEPSNPGFESGDFTDWDVAGSPSIAGDASGGSAALLTSSSDRVTSSVVPLPPDAGVVTVDVGYVSPTGYSWLNVYALHGSGFVQETKLGQSLCRACAGDWVSASFDASAFAGEEVKFEFRTYLGYDVKVDNVAVLGSVPGWSLSGGAGHDAAGGGFVSLPSGDAVSDSFVLDPDVEVLELDVRKQSTYTTYYRAELLTGPGFSTVVDLGYRYPQSTSWETVGYNVAEWAGEEVQLRIAKVYNAIDIDNAGVQQVVVPDWWFSGSVELVDDGEGGLRLRPVRHLSRRHSRSGRKRSS